MIDTKSGQRISRRAAEIPRSGIRLLMERAAGRSGVIHLEVGEPSFRTPQHIIDAAHEAALAGYTRYTANEGLPQLRQALAEAYASRWGVPVAPDQVVVSAGAVNAITAVLAAIVDPGDAVLVPDPGWPNYLSICGLLGVEAIPYRLHASDGFTPRIDELEAAIVPRSRAIIINNPSNPTGAVFDRETVHAIVDVATRHDLLVISDEIYEELVFDGEHVPAAPFDRDGRVVTVSGFSKTYAMTGWRLGYAIGPREIIAASAKLMESLVSCASSISQMAGLAALTGPQDEVRTMREAYARRRQIVFDAFAPAGLLVTPPRGAFYALVDLKLPDLDGLAIAEALLDEAGVATAPGPTFGSQAHGMIRVSLASSDDDVREGCRRILDFSARHATG